MSKREFEYLSLALDQANRLKELLETEFSALKEQDLNAFDNLQPEKVEILSLLASDELAAKVKNQHASPTEASMRISIKTR